MDKLKNKSRDRNNEVVDEQNYTLKDFSKILEERYPKRKRTTEVGRSLL